MKTYAKDEAIERINRIDGIGALIKTQDDLRRVANNLTEYDGGRQSY